MASNLLKYSWFPFTAVCCYANGEQQYYPYANALFLELNGGIDWHGFYGYLVTEHVYFS